MAIEINGQTFPHKYLFRADYKDGESYEQGSEDKSLQKEDKNAFFDIFYQPIKPLTDLLRFNLIGEGHIYTVDLTDGHFEIDGIPFHLNDEDSLKDFRLVFFKRHFHHTTVGGKGMGHDIHYFIGWQTTVNGKNHKQMIQIN